MPCTPTSEGDLIPAWVGQYLDSIGKQHAKTELQAMIATWKLPVRRARLIVSACSPALARTRTLCADHVRFKAMSWPP
eukprot:3415735-Alexandrium_andersonii.AAC.1